MNFLGIAHGSMASLEDLGARMQVFEGGRVGRGFKEGFGDI